MAVQISVALDSVTYTEGVPRIDLLALQDTTAWQAAGVRFHGRANAVTIPGAGVAATWANALPQTVDARQPTGQSGTLTLRTDAGYFGTRKTIEAAGIAGDLFYWALSENIIPTSGPFEIWLAVHPTTGTFRLLGQSDTSKLSASIVSGEIRLNFANSGSGTYSVNANKATGNFAGNDVLVHLRRDADNVAHVRYKLPGLAWVEAVSPYPITAGAAGTGAVLVIGGDLRFGSYRAQASYTPNGRWGGMLVAVADLPASVRAAVDAYLVAYFGMA